MNQRKAKECQRDGHRVRSLAEDAFLYGVNCTRCGDYLGDALGSWAERVKDVGVRYERSGRWIVKPDTSESDRT